MFVLICSCLCAKSCRISNNAASSTSITFIYYTPNTMGSIELWYPTGRGPLIFRNASGFSYSRSLCYNPDDDKSVLGTYMYRFVGKEAKNA